MQVQNVGRFHYPISKIFGPRLIKNWNNDEFEENLKHILVNSGIVPHYHSWNMVEALQLSYNYLKMNYRCEYVYKNEIANQLLFTRHNDNSATLLREFTVNQSIADVVIVNGISSVYEVKTELDNFARLQSQIDDYMYVFDEISIVTHSAAIKSLKKLVSPSIGIILLGKKNELIYERPPILQRNNFNAEIASLCLRQRELECAYVKQIGSIPDVGTGYIGTFYRNWFKDLPSELARVIFNESLKSRKLSDCQFDLVKKAPRELKMLFLGHNITNKECKIIIGKLLSQVVNL